MNPEYLAEIERFRLMDDTFMSKCLENAPECIELILQIILGKKDLKVVKSQTEYPIKNLQGRGVRFDVFARDSKGKEYDIEIQRAKDGAEPKRARYNSALMDANALKRCVWARDAFQRRLAAHHARRVALRVFVSELQTLANNLNKQQQRKTKMGMRKLTGKAAILAATIAASAAISTFATPMPENTPDYFVEWVQPSAALYVDTGVIGKCGVKAELKYLYVQNGTYPHERPGNKRDDGCHGNLRRT